MTQRDLSITDTIDGGGAASIAITTNGFQTWIVSQVSIECTGAGAGSLAGLYLDGRLITRMVPNGGAAGGDPPVRLPQGRTLEVRWTGCTPGAAVSALVFYQYEGTR